jgi:hypothetical protein
LLPFTGSLNGITRQKLADAARAAIRIYARERLGGSA